MLAAALAAAATVCAGCRTSQGGGSVGGSVGAQTSAAPAYAAGDLSLLVEPDQGLAPIYALMASARRSIDLTMYELVDTDAELALEQAASRGVVVRVLLDTNRERAANQAAYTELTDLGVRVTWADARYAATHQKTLVVDGSVAVVMSLNLTRRFYSDTRDFAVLDRNPADVAAIESVFDADYRHAKVASAAGTGLIWSPRQSGPALLALIDGATSSLLVENEELAYPAVTAALSRAARRGVHVVVVMTDATQWHQAFATLVAAGVAVRVIAQKAPLYIHAKVVVADIGTPQQRAFTGSENFSAASLNHNRELGVQTADRAVVTGLAAVIEGDAAGAATWRP
jgi:phosphatidylserine/phosphatidylglycerophosphate/cardiolipin synthase-like enzyme